MCCVTRLALIGLHGLTVCTFFRPASRQLLGRHDIDLSLFPHTLSVIDRDRVLSSSAGP